MTTARCQQSSNLEQSRKGYGRALFLVSFDVYCLIEQLMEIVLECPVINDEDMSDQKDEMISTMLRK